MLFGIPLGSGCGLRDIYILVMIIYALEGISTPPKPMVFYRFLMVLGNAPGAPEPWRSLNNYHSPRVDYNMIITVITILNDIFIVMIIIIINVQ